MKASLKKRLEADGWRVGTVQEFLGLSDAEVELIEIRLALGDGLRKRRRAARITQATFAKRLKSSQSRVAKMEAGDTTVSFELLIRAHLVLGATRRDIGRMLAARTAA